MYVQRVCDNPKQCHMGLEQGGASNCPAHPDQVLRAHRPAARDNDEPRARRCSRACARLAGKYSPQSFSKVILSSRYSP